MKNSNDLVNGFLAHIAVRHSNGSVDREATVAKLVSALNTYIQERDTESEVVLDLVRQVFDSQPAGMYITLPTLAQIVVQKMGVPLASFAPMLEVVKDRIRCAAGTRESGSVFGITKGPGAGVCRWATTPVKESKHLHSGTRY
jgi:hypothetical protein